VVAIDAVVSIHTCVKRVTRNHRRCHDMPRVSIHTRVKRVTPRVWARRRCLRRFNPHPREAGDAARSSTGNWLTGFNPHPREAGDSTRVSSGTRTTTFQSTPA